MNKLLSTLTFPVLLCIQLSSQAPHFSWLQTSGSGSTDEGTHVIADRYGNVFAGGYFNDTIDLNGAAPGGVMAAVLQSDIFFARFDSSGNLAWNIHLGATGSENVRSINLDSAGRVLITGTFQDPMDFDPGPANVTLSPTGFTNVFVACYDTAGNYQWAKRIGGNVSTESSDMAVDPSGEIVLLGRFLGNCDFDPSALSMVLHAPCNSMFIGRYDASGNYLDVKPFYDTLVGVSIEVNAQSDLYVGGYFMGDADVNPDTAATVLLSTAISLPDIFLAKYTSSGSYVWAKQISGPGSEYFTALKSDGSSLYISGYYNDTVDFDPGTGTQLKASSGVDGFIAKFDTSGALYWVNTMGWTGHDEIQSLDLTPDGDICAAGRFYISCDVDPSANTVNLTAPLYSLFVAAYSSASGDYIWSFAPENSNESGAGEMSISRTGGIYIAGQFRDIVDFDADTTTALGTSWPFSTDIFIVKYQLDGLAGVEENGSPVTFIVYPNPGNGHSTLAYSLNETADVKYELLDLSGRLILSADNGTQAAGNYFLPVSDQLLAPGTYIIRMTIGNKVSSKKFVLPGE